MWNYDFLKDVCTLPLNEVQKSRKLVQNPGWE